MFNKFFLGKIWVKILLALNPGFMLLGDMVLEGFTLTCQIQSIDT